MTLTELEKWWFTFGCGINDPHRKCYIVIEGGWLDARSKMIKRFGRGWSHQYASAEAAGVKEFNLKEIKEVSVKNGSRENAGMG